MYEFGSAVSEMLRFYVKTRKRDNSETALPIKISKFRKRISIENTPQNLEKITSETTFGHSKVVFGPLLHTKSFHLPISALLWDGCGHQGGSKTTNSTVGLFRLAWDGIMVRKITKKQTNTMAF